MKKLLFIEDDDFAFQSIALLLEDIGYPDDRIIRCTHLREVADVIPSELEIVLTDLTLPDASYPETFEQVIKKFPNTPIIVLTGTAEINVAISTIQHGAQDYLVKGEFNHKMLEKAIQYAIERNRILGRAFIEKQNLRAIVNNTQDIIWSVDKNHGIISANKAFWERIYKICGKRKCDVKNSDFDKELLKTWAAFYDWALSGEVYKMVWVEENNGSKTYEEVRFNLIHDKDENIIGVSCFSRDITRQYKYLKMIKKQNDQLRKIAWVQSHEVRGPVASILGIAQLFNIDNPGHVDNIEILENLQIAANKLDEIIRKINSYTTTAEENN